MPASWSLPKLTYWVAFSSGIGSFNFTLICRRHSGHPAAALLSMQLTLQLIFFSPTDEHCSLKIRHSPKGRYHPLIFQRVHSFKMRMYRLEITGPHECTREMTRSNCLRAVKKGCANLFRVNLPCALAFPQSTFSTFVIRRANVSKPWVILSDVLINLLELFVFFKIQLWWLMPQSLYYRN